MNNISSTPPIIELHRWHISGKNISLVQQGDILAYQIKDTRTGKHEDTAPIDTNGSAIDTIAKSLLKLLPILEKGKDLEFRDTTVCIKKKFQNIYKVKLHLLNKKLLWQITNNKSQESFCYPFDTSSITSNASTHTKRFFNRIHNRNVNEIISSLSKEHMELVFTGKTLNPAKMNLSELRLRPRSCKTQLDKRILVSRLTWAVTLISNGGTNNLGGKCDGNHAQILVEGVGDDGQFVMLLDFDKGGPRVKTLIGTPANIEQRSKTWKVSSRQADQMIASVRKDRKEYVNYYNKKKKFNFSIFGKYSILGCFAGKAGSHNCFSWAQKTLKIVNIPLKISFIDWITCPRVKKYTKKPQAFKKLKDSCESPNSL